MRMGLFGHLFDSNNDGKLDFDEEVRRQLWFEHEKNLRDQRSKESQNRRPTISYTGGRYPINTWEDEYRNNIFGVDPNFYLDDEAEKVCPSLFQDTENMCEELQRNMKISASKKKTFLQETFELLKEDYISNADAIRDIIGKMAKLDCDCAVGMWKYLIEAYPETLHGFYDFGYIIMNTLEQAVDRETVYRLVVEDSFLKNAIFSELGDMQYSPIQAIRFYVFSGQTEIANELLTLSYNNKYRRTSFFEILDGILNNYYDEWLGEDGFEMLMGWIAKVKSKQERAKLNLAMLNYMEEE